MTIAVKATCMKKQVSTTATKAVWKAKEITYAFETANSIHKKAPELMVLDTKWRVQEKDQITDNQTVLKLFLLTVNDLSVEISVVLNHVAFSSCMKSAILHFMYHEVDFLLTKKEECQYPRISVSGCRCQIKKPRIFNWKILNLESSCHRLIILYNSKRTELPKSSTYFKRR